MPKFLIEREIPNAGALSATDLRNIAKKSCAVLRELGADIQWVQSYVTEDKITCIYISTSMELIPRACASRRIPRRPRARDRGDHRSHDRGRQHAGSRLGSLASRAK